MAIRKLLLPLTGTAAGEAALTTALLAARRWQAHLAALHVRGDSRDVAHMAGEGLSGAMIAEMMTATERESERRADAVRALFDRFVAAHGVRVAQAEPGQTDASAEFMAMTGREEDRIASQARLADATIVAHPDTAEDVSSSDVLHAVLFDSGRPVLISPAAAPAGLGDRICLAWSGTAESAAAARFAIPWLQQATDVTILNSREYQKQGPSAAELAAYLALHGIAARHRAFGAVAREVGAGMLAAAHEEGADMLVMGAYSSSRLRQMILGGVTRYVIEHADLPVLMCR
jgi:nucleotide-binding universal stress UspA family protein